MKKTLCTLFLILSIILPFNVIEAHPGRTDANGGHTCRTNCEKWGLQYGEYHYHNGGKSSNGSSSSHASGSSKPSSNSNPKSKQTVAPTVQKKTIVAVDKGYVFSSPYDSNAITSLWYGYEIKDLGSEYEGYAFIEQGYISKSLLAQYAVIKAKTVKVQADKGYFFSTPSASSLNRGYAVKGTAVTIVGEGNGFYYGSTKDANGNTLVGFISKTVAY
ncbi:UNVERIFIED_CONTAM: hypothetical protein ABID98_001366 [Brevibacillus sp. OAP136]